MPTRFMYEPGSVRSVQPGRGKTSVGRIRITAIRRERACDITEADAIAEGYGSVEAFRRAWVAMHGERAWTAEVWVLGFERA